MKNIFTLAVLLFCGFMVTAQDEIKWPSVDKSKLDSEMYPGAAAWRNYMDGDERNIQPKIKVVYSRPSMNERTIFGDLVPYGKEWRLGANESTSITFYQAVDINGTTVNPGNYTMFADVNQNDWTIHFSSESGISGNTGRDKSKDVASVKVKTDKVSDNQELFSMTFQEVDDMHCNLVVEWEKTRVSLPIAFNPVQFSGVDASPMDLAHYPNNSRFNNFRKEGEPVVDAKIQVLYSRPYKKGRDVFGDLLKVGDIWRVGANQSTEITLFEDMKIGNTELKRGKYALYAKLNNGSWDLIFSKDYPAWGDANRDETKDVATVNIPTYTDSEVLENLSITFDEKSSSLVHMLIGWDKMRAAVPFTLSPMNKS